MTDFLSDTGTYRRYPKDIILYITLLRNTQYQNLPKKLALPRLAGFTGVKHPRFGYPSQGKERTYRYILMLHAL
jgi:hypothetical protein